MRNGTYGINEQQLENLVINIYDLSDQLAKTFEKIEEKVDSTKNFYQSTDGDEYRDKFSRYIEQFETIVLNMRRYGDDLLRVKAQYKQNIAKNVDIFSKK